MHANAYKLVLHTCRLKSFIEMDALNTTQAALSQSTVSGHAPLRLRRHIASPFSRRRAIPRQTPHSLLQMATQWYIPAIDNKAHVNGTSAICQFEKFARARVESEAAPAVHARTQPPPPRAARARTVRLWFCRCSTTPQQIAREAK